LARIGYEKPSTKLTFYKAFFSSQWKFLIHTILQCMSAKRTAWNKFSSSMASAVICLSIGRKFNFSKYIFDSLMRNVDTSFKFYMYPRFLQLMIRAQVGDLSSHTTKYSSPTLTQKVFANMRRVGKGFSEVETPLFEGMIVAQQAGEGAAEVNVDDVPAAGVTNEGVAAVNVDDVHAANAKPSIASPPPTTQSPPVAQQAGEGAAEVNVDDVPAAGVTNEGVAAVNVDDVHAANAEPSIASPPPTTQSPPPSQEQEQPSTSQNLEQDKIAQALEITKLKQRVKTLEMRNKLKVSKLRRLKKVGTAQRVETSDDTVIDDGRPAKSQAQIYQIDLEHADKVLSMTDQNTSQYPDDPNMPELEDITYCDDEEDVGAEADFTNLETNITISPIPTTRVHKDHPVTQIIGDLSSATQTRSMTRVVKDQGGLTQINNDDFHTCMFSCFLLQEEPKREEGIDYEEVFASVARIKAIRLFLAYASFIGFMVYQMDVKSAFLYGTIEEEVHVCQPPGFKDHDYSDKVYKVAKALYGLHQAHRAWYETLANYLLENGFQREKIDHTLFIKRQKNGKSASTPIDTEKPLLKDPDVDEKVGIEVCVVDLKVTAVRLIVTAVSSKFLLFDASEGFDQIIDFLNASSIKYALTVNPNIYVSCIKQFWSTVSVKKVNDVMRLQALVDKKKAMITEATIREALRLDDAESIDCLPNEEIFTELSRMGSSMASAVICLSTGRKFNFSKYIFDSLVRNVDSSTKFYKYPRFIQLMIRAQVGDLSSHSTKYSSLALTQKVFANMRRVGKEFSGVDTSLFEGMIVAQQADNVADEGAADVDAVLAATDEPSIPSPTPTTQPPHHHKIFLPPHKGIIDDIDSDEDVTLKDVAAIAKDVKKIAKIKENADVQGRQAESQAQIYQIDLEHADKVLSMHDDELEPTKLKKVVEVVTTAKLMTKGVTAASATITVADTSITTATLTAAPSAARRRKGVVIRDPEETSTPSIIIHSEPKSKDKGKWIMVEEPKPLKKQAQIEQDEAYAREYQALKRKPQTEAQARKNMMIYMRNMVGFKMNYFKGMTYDNIRPIFEKYFNSNVAFLEKTKEQLEDLEVLWQLVKERLASSKPKKFLDDFLLTTLTYMFEKPDVQAQVWKNQRIVHGLANVKSWRLLESCGVHIITFTSTQMILLVERRYPLTRFTLDQMLNNVRLKVKEESLWFNVIKAIYGNEGFLHLSYCKLVVGNGHSINFWQDKWYGEVPFKDKFKRCFNLELQKDISFALKMQSNDIAISFRRRPRSGIEESQFCDLNSLLASIVLSDAADRWSWTLCGHGEFFVKSVREVIDQQVLITSSTPSRWSKVIPIKLNIFMWRMLLEKLPTRSNLVNRGLDVPCLLCSIFRMGVESRDHLFFDCSLALDLFRLLGRWWSLQIPILQDHSARSSWFSNLRLNKMQKLVLKASFSSMRWHIWVFRNATLFSSKKPLKGMIFDNFVSQTFTWVSNRCKNFNCNWVDWLKDSLNAFSL
nr:RNA-directed DNA polymerase, eukaryota, reverse transcriptase zinc-binding domain protein [Tanacetum cinerariifolium]